MIAGKGVAIGLVEVRVTVVKSSVKTIANPTFQVALL
jgi:hypothetical protein